MIEQPATSADSTRLRIVFEHAVVFCKLGADATLSDVAEAWNAAISLHDGDTIWIAVTVDPSLPMTAAWRYPAMSGAVRGGPTASVAISPASPARPPTRRTTAAARTAIRLQIRAERLAAAI